MAELCLVETQTDRLVQAGQDLPLRPICPISYGVQSTWQDQSSAASGWKNDPRNFHYLGLGSPGPDLDACGGDHAPEQHVLLALDE